MTFTSRNMVKAGHRPAAPAGLWVLGVVQIPGLTSGATPERPFRGCRTRPGRVTKPSAATFEEQCAIVSKARR